MVIFRFWTCILPPIPLHSPHILIRHFENKLVLCSFKFITILNQHHISDFQFHFRRFHIHLHHHHLHHLLILLLHVLAFLSRVFFRCTWDFFYPTSQIEASEQQQNELLPEHIFISFHTLELSLEHIYNYSSNYWLSCNLIIMLINVKQKFISIVYSKIMYFIK